MGERNVVLDWLYSRTDSTVPVLPTVHCNLALDLPACILVHARLGRACSEKVRAAASHSSLPGGLLSSTPHLNRIYATASLSTLFPLCCAPPRAPISLPPGPPFFRLFCCRRPPPHLALAAVRSLPPALYPSFPVRDSSFVTVSCVLRAVLNPHICTLTSLSPSPSPSISTDTMHVRVCARASSPRELVLILTTR